ncbi:MAG: HIT family protein [Desulfonatronovibrionaceae bacterium]
MHDCIFCRVVQGEIPSKTVLETETVLGFLDISPVQPGHTVLIPKKHYPTLLDVPADLGKSLLAAQKEIAAAMMSGLFADGVNLGMNVHEAAGQLVFHAHFHLIPRYRGDNLSLWKQGVYESDQAMEEAAAGIRGQISV